MKFSSPCVLGLLSTVTLLAVGSDATIRGGDSNRGSRLGRTTSTSRHLAMGNTGKSSVSKSSKKSSKKSGKGDACFPAGAKVDVFDDETSNFVETNIEDVKVGTRSSLPSFFSLDSSFSSTLLVWGSITLDEATLSNCLAAW